MSDTVIGKGLKVNGSLKSAGDVRLAGQVVGMMEVDGVLEVEPSGVVLSDVRAARLRCAGTVEGNVQGGERVDLLAGARLKGNVRAPRLTIADGASFRGQVEMESAE